jgi:hypothetical protein
MRRAKRLLSATLFGASVLLVPSAASAGPLRDWLCYGGCPAPSYSPLRYWAPGPARVSDCVHGPRLSSYAPDTHPEIAPTFTVLKFPCQPADPAATLIPVPPDRGVGSAPR